MIKLSCICEYFYGLVDDYWTIGVFNCVLIHQRLVIDYQLMSIVQSVDEFQSKYSVSHDAGVHDNILELVSQSDVLESQPRT